MVPIHLLEFLMSRGEKTYGWNQETLNTYANIIHFIDRYPYMLNSSSLLFEKQKSLLTVEGYAKKSHKLNMERTASLEQQYMNNKIFYRKISLEFIAGGTTTFTIIPEIAGMSLNKYISLRVIGTDNISSRKYVDYSKIFGKRGNIICFYVLLYPSEDKLIAKIGNSKYENCVVRMYQQAPIIAIVAEIIVLEKEIKNIESLDKKLALELSRKFGHKNIKVISKISKEIVLNSWKFIMKSKSDGIIDELLEQGFELAYEISNSLSKLGQAILPSPGYAWFSSLGALSKQDMELLKTLRYLDYWQSYKYIKLRHLPNGLFHLVLPAKGLDGRAIESLITYNDFKNLCFEVIKNE
jgi:hypothetical protein